MVDSLISIAVEKLNTILQDEVVLLVGVTNEIKKLSSWFTLIQAVLKDAETRRLKNEAVKKWLEKLKDVAYDVDDILDELMTEALKSQAPDEDSVSCFSKKKVRSFLSSVNCFNHVVLRHKIGSRIKEVRVRLYDIEKEKSQLGLRGDSGVREREDIEVWRLDRQSVVGRQDDKNEILNLLLRESSGEVNEVPFVISIVGMGGLGKTTLAQLAYNDEKVEQHFEMRMWVRVSEDFDVKRITKSIIKSATGSSYENLDQDQLQSRLREMLHAKRFLLVLDDVWSEGLNKWHTLRLSFETGALGSRIVITTRREDVAWALESGRIHKLAVLSDDDCWLLFRRGALEHRSAEEYSELEEIGRVIVKKCGGLPFAARAIGSVMRLRRTRREWELVLETWNSGNFLGGILPSLLLSYHDLPPVLKICFTYFSIFPKDSWIEKDVIVKLWAAQGFIHSNTGSHMEEIGGSYFDDLLRRSLLQDAELDYDNNIRKCKMHGLVHDLAQSVAGSDCSLVEMGKQGFFNPNNFHHSFLVVSDEAGEVDPSWATLYKAHKLRTLLRDSRTFTVPQDLFHHFRFLRALDLSRTDMKKLPQTVGKLKHLRYLDLSYTDIEELPDGLSNCINLQTLRLNFCQRLRKLPKWISKMISLRHLEFQSQFTIDSTHHVSYLPQGITRLTGLQTLTDFIVGGGDEGCKCGDLKHFRHLGGRLQIFGLENVRSSDEAREAELDKKQNLHSLSLQYDSRHGEPLDDEGKRTEDVLESLRPHTNLKELNVWCYQGSKLPKWTEDPVFSNLLKVELQHCRKCKQLPSFGKLPSLKFLKIVGMTEVRKVGSEFDNNGGSGGGVSFPKLQILIFSDMPNWEEWELRGRDGEVMPSLLELEINDCGKLKALPCNLPPDLIRKLTLDMNNDGMSSGGP